MIEPPSERLNNIRLDHRVDRKLTAAIIQGGDVVFLYGGIIAGIIAVAIGVWYGKYKRKLKIR